MRTCGACTMCCTVMEIPEYGSPGWETCKHCDGGCGIYETRPPRCANFACLWLRQPQIPDALRPDLAGIMFELPDGCATYIGHVAPGGKPQENLAVHVLIQKIMDAGNPVIVYDREKSSQHWCIPFGMTKQDIDADLDRALARYAA